MRVLMMHVFCLFHCLARGVHWSHPRYPQQYMSMGQRFEPTSMLPGVATHPAPLPDASTGASMFVMCPHPHKQAAECAGLPAPQIMGTVSGRQHQYLEEHRSAPLLSHGGTQGWGPRSPIVLFYAWPRGSCG